MQTGSFKWHGLPSSNHTYAYSSQILVFDKPAPNSVTVVQSTDKETVAVNWPRPSAVRNTSTLSCFSVSLRSAGWVSVHPARPGMVLAKAPYRENTKVTVSTLFPVPRAPHTLISVRFFSKNELSGPTLLDAPSYVAVVE